jgi:hypothetical protein
LPASSLSSFRVVILEFDAGDGSKGGERNG